MNKDNFAHPYLFVISATSPGILLLLYDVCDALKIALIQDFQSPSSSFSFAILTQNQNKLFAHAPDTENFISVAQIRNGLLVTRLPSDAQSTLKDLKTQLRGNRLFLYAAWRLETTR